MGLKFVAALAAVYIAAGIASASPNKIVCYHGTWSTYRHGNGKFTVEDIDPNVCTHIIYSFVGINPDGTIKLLDSYLDIDTGNFKRFNAHKQKNPKLKTLVAIGGWNEGSEVFSAVAASASKRATLVKSALNLVQTYGFDGFDLDWEYPGQRGGAASDKQNFNLLLKEFRKEFDKHGLLLTAAVAAAGPSVDLSYDVPSLSKYLDFINVMAYDLHGSWDGITGQNAPLYASSVDEKQGTQDLTVEASIKGWIARGAAPEKIILGLGSYGRSYTLANSNHHDLGAPVVNGGNKGKYTQESGMLGYNEIVEMQLAGGWTVVWDNIQKVPYMYKGNQWVGYDNPESIAIKVEWAKSLNLGGLMLWSLETEDFKGLSGTKYQLLKTVKKALGGTANENLDPEVPPPKEEPEKPEQPQPETPEEPNTDELCTKAGYVRDPKDCAVFYYCLPSGGTFKPLKQQCSAGLVFDTERVSCNWPALVKC